MQHRADNNSTAQLIEALEALRGKKRFMVLLAKGADVLAEQNYFRLEGLSAAEKQQLACCPRYRQGKEFPWELFCRAVDLPRALPTLLWLLYGVPRRVCSKDPHDYMPDVWPLSQKLWSASNQQHLVRISPFERAFWGDDAAWLALLRLGNACRWGVGALWNALKTAGPDSGLSPRMRIVASRVWVKADANPSIDAVETNTYGLLDPLLAEAVNSDTPSRVIITLDMCSHTTQEMFHYLTNRTLSARVLCHCLRTFPESAFHATFLDILVYIVTTWTYEAAKPVILTIEELRPGSTRDYRDGDGRNLLWYVGQNIHLNHFIMPPREGAYNLDMFKFLVGTIGLSPFEADKYGYTFADFDAVVAVRGKRVETIGLTPDIPLFTSRAYWGEKDCGAAEAANEQG